MAHLHFEASPSAGQAGRLPDFGLAAGTSVLTLDGALPVEFLTPGDPIVTRSGVRRLKVLEMTAIGGARLIRVAAEVFGSGRPGTPVRLMPGQKVLLRDWRAKALYGTAQALVPVSRLEDGEFIRQERLAQARIFTLRLDRPAVIYAGGLEIACEGVTAEA